MSENRVDLGNVRGNKGSTGVGINRVELVSYNQSNCVKTYRMYFTDNTENNPHYFEFSLTDNDAIKRLNTISQGNPNSDKKDVPTIYLLKQELNKKISNEQLLNTTFTKQEIINLIASEISSLDIFIPVNQLPTSNIKDNVIYLLYMPNNSGGDVNPTFDLYAYIDNDWVHLDSLSVNLSDYYNKTTINSLLNNKQETSNLSVDVSTDASSNTKYPSVKAIKNYTDNLLSDYYNKQHIDNEFDTLQDMIADIQDFIHS